ncbi:MAG: histidine phosphatase family protein [Chloroflexota bacterium]
MPIKRLVFIRPGETDWNLQGRWQGWVASPLNELGQQQMARLAGFIRHIGITRLYTSDLHRARQSAEILAEELGQEPIYDSRLRERSIGEFQGLNVPEIHGWYQDEYRKLLADPEGYRVPGGESIEDVRVRVRQFLDEILAEGNKAKGDQTIAVLSHTIAIRLMVKQLQPSCDLTDVTFLNSSVTTLVNNGDDTWRLTAVNDVSHLEGLETRYMPADLRGDDV